nr:hypothetical protein [Tanacetum cinerariifolium]
MNLNRDRLRLKKNTTQSTPISKINDLIGEIIPCSDLSSRNVLALSAKRLEVIEVVTTAKLMTEVVTAAATTTTVAPITTAPSAARRQKGMSYDDIRPIFEKHFNSNQAVKKQKFDEEVEELKTHLQIIPNDEDDVYTEATPLALKVPVVDYQIHIEHNKPYYKIIKADGTHQLFLSFISLLRNFDREDLEILWKIVREIFASSKPKNFSNDFLLNTLKIMFEKHNVVAHIWKNQRGSYGLANVKSWKLLESCGVHIITFITTQMKLKVRDLKYFKEQMLLVMKDEAGSNLSNEENDFMLDTSYGEELEELKAAVMLVDRIQPTDKNVETVPSYDATAVSQVYQEREDQYLDDILDLEEKLSSHDRIVYKIGQTIQTIHMLGKKPNKIYDPFLKAGIEVDYPIFAAWETCTPANASSITIHWKN